MTYRYAWEITDGLSSSRGKKKEENARVGRNALPPSPSTCANDQACRSVADHRLDRRKSALSDLFFATTLAAQEVDECYAISSQPPQIRRREKKVLAAAIISAPRSPLAFQGRQMKTAETVSGTFVPSTRAFTAVKPRNPSRGDYDRVILLSNRGRLFTSL